MSIGRKGLALLATWIVLATAPAAWAKPTAAEILRYRPRIEGVNVSTPSAEEQNACTVELVTAKNGGSGWVVRDSQGRLLRRFFDSNADKKIDIWSYYLDGVEVYREIDSNLGAKDGKADQFRWLNGGGMKWGVAGNAEGKIDGWKMISAEEASQEIVAALIAKDFARLQPLFINEAEIRGLDLPQAEANRLLELQKQAYAKFQATVAKLTNLNEKTHWVHLETAQPECLPADQTGARQDLIRYKQATILCETAGKNDWLQTGEMIKVGEAWRIVDAPSPGEGAADNAAAQLDPALQSLLDQLRDHDSKAPKGVETAPAEIVGYNLKRANMLEQIVAKVKPEEREQWIRQIADCLGAAAQNSPDADKTPYERLQRLEEQIVKALPGSNLAAYVTFREMQADNAAKLGKPGPDITKVQEQWLDRLAKFVESYPRAEDTPEALLQLGMVSEFVNKEAQSKKWYAMLAKNFAEHPLAGKAQGALRRLEMEGKPLELAGNTLDGAAFNLAQLRGKVAIVYYWASWSNKERCISDFAVLKSIMENYGPKGAALVCVNLDNSAEEASAFVQKQAAPGIHLFQAGGLESSLATQYGVMLLPNLFLVDGEGKVISRGVQQVSGLEEELKKRLK
jgi:Thioredoxin-like